MAHNSDNDPEEDNNKPKGSGNSDDDFGLPEFEYEELEDDDSDDEDASGSDAVEEDSYTSTSSTSDSDFDSSIDEYSSETASDSLDFSSTDSSKIDFDDDEIDLDLSTDEIDFSTDYKVANSDDTYYDDSTFTDEDFKDFEPSDNVDLMGNYRNPASESTGRGGFTKIIVFGVILFFLIAAGLMYWNSQITDSDSSNKIVKVEKSRPTPTKQDEPESKPETETVAVALPDTKEPEKKEPEPILAKVEEPKTQPAAKVEEPKTQPTTQPKTQPTTQPKTQPVATVSAGEDQIVRLTSSTGRSYIVAGSFFDEDMARDFCKKLLKQGVQNPTIIPPFKDTKFYRVAIADYASYREAADAMDQFKGTYGQDIWALKY